MKKQKGSVNGLVRQLRKDSTPSEQKLWAALKTKQLGGLKFRRQHPIHYAGKANLMTFYVVDFYCPEKKLVIELDGSVHDGRELFDALRDDNLAAIGIRVLRFKNSELENMEKVFEEIWGVLNLNW